MDPDGPCAVPYTGRMRLVLGLSMALACAACGGDDGGSVGTDAGVDAAIDAPARPRLFGGMRPITLQVPTDFDGSHTYPLLIILHGYGVNGPVQQAYFGLGGAADSAQTLILAPNGTVDAGGKQFWNADAACCDVGHTGVDDVAYLGGLIDDVAAAWPVDRARITVLGHSNGAFMAYRLACARADVVSAIAGLAGHATSAAVPCTPVHPVSVLHIQGTADAVVPYATGPFNGVPSPGAIDSVAQWATRNGCTGAPAAAGTKDLDSMLPGAETTVAVTGGCPASGAADLWTIAGGAHIPSLTATFKTDVLAWLAAHHR